MSQTLIDIGHLIALDGSDQDRPVITGTRTSVRQIVALHRLGYSPDEIVMDKNYLTLAQVHAALAYYYANPTAIDADLEAEAQAYDRLVELHRSTSYPQVVPTVSGTGRSRGVGSGLPFIRSDQDL